MDEQLKAWDIIIERFSASDAFFAKVIAAQKAWAQRHGAYALNNAPNYQLAYEHYFGKLYTSTDSSGKNSMSGEAAL